MVNLVTKNESWKVERDENGDSLLIIPEEYSDEFAADDVIEYFNTKQGDIAFRNLSCVKLPASRLKRNFNSVQRKLNSHTDKLKRVIITLNNKKVAIVTSSEDMELAKVVQDRKDQAEVEVKLEDL